MIEGVRLLLVSQAAQIGWMLPPLVALEMLWPQGAVSWSSRFRGLALRGVYIVLTAVILALIGAGLAQLGVKPLFHIARPSWVTAAGVTLLTALLADFLYYWTHRLQHRFFWRYHAIHHAIEDLSAVNGYLHWTEELFRIPLMTLPLALLVPVGGGWAPAITWLVVLQSYYIHSQTRLNFGPLRRVLIDNRFHRIHHSVEERHFDKNFATLTPIWDVMFGTACFPKANEWPRTGLAEEAEVDGAMDYLFRPFRRAPHISSSTTNA